MNNLIVNEEKDLSQITIDNAYPNPAQDKVTIKWSNYSVTETNLKMSIVDVSGKEVRSEKIGSISGTNATEISVSDLIEGSYLFQISNEEKSISKSYKIVVVK
jgi:hypothetical protein